MPKCCLTLNLKDDPALIDTRLFMIMDTGEGFSFEKKGGMDATNPKVQEWEILMWNYQQPLKKAVKGEKWVLMNKIFEL